MKDSVFINLLKKAELDTGNDLETVGFTAKLNQYEMSFYAEMVTGHNVTIEDFGHNYGSNWNQLEPTQEQRLALQRLMNKTVEKLEKREDQPEQEYLDPYAEFGLSESMFFNQNNY
ncbi:hypothetical protein [Leeuwenhoekiella sp. MAR_2009_132]|uniref:hypothetical protein n=1 Tax=Leeuwenhoekiella sp. MAR_2009_132 TaxID=1392489 RepID=UPI00049008CE|nr:hypothetical protein [Leeuwenhoekiella sp. MAR_2009_132]